MVAEWDTADTRRTADAIDVAQSALDTIARAIHSEASSMHDQRHWVGDAQRAAEDCAEQESRRMIRCAGWIGELAGHYRTAADNIDSARTALQNKVGSALEAGATVADDWTVGPGTIEDPAIVDYWRWEIVGALGVLVEVDEQAAQAIRNTLDELEALAPKSSGMSGIEARQLATRIANSAQLGDLAIDRLLNDLEGAQLNTEQRAALGRGENVVVSQGTLDYLQELYGTLDVEGFLELSDQLAGSGHPEARAWLADGLALAVDPRIVSDAETDTGGLTPQITEFLSGPATTVDQGIDPPITVTTVHNAGLLDRFTQAYGAGDAALQQDNPLNRALIERAGELASVDRGPGADVALEGAGNTSFDSLVEHLVETGGRDRGSVHDLMVDTTARDETILPLLQYDWSDTGDAHVAEMFSWIGSDAVPDGDDPADLARATRAGETTFGLSQLLHEHHTDLLDLPNSDNKSIGEVNPTLTRSMATAVSPYLAEMVGFPAKTPAPTASACWVKRTSRHCMRRWRVTRSSRTSGWSGDGDSCVTRAAVGLSRTDIGQSASRVRNVEREPSRRGRSRSAHRTRESRAGHRRPRNPVRHHQGRCVRGGIGNPCRRRDRRGHARTVHARGLRGHLQPRTPRGT